MIDPVRASLRQLLIKCYADLKRQLARRLGSADAATEVLHETWLRLGGTAEIGAVQQPRSYLYRVALNVAADLGRSEARWLGKIEREALLHADDDQLDPERVAAARSEIAALERVIAAMPPRRREIFLAALVEELPYRAIAERFGMSLRSVEREMARAFDHCDQLLEKKITRRAGRPPRESSQGVKRR
jgi:RNA polymerase sigma-70 factor (ECF subfamily)